MQNGADLTQKDKLGRTPLDIAKVEKRVDIVEYFEAKLSNS